MTYLDDTLAKLAAALAGIGVPVIMDPSAVVAPCLFVDSTPERVIQSVCGVVRSWDATLIPPPTTDWLAAQWLAGHLDAVRDALDTAPDVAVVAELRAEWKPDPDGPGLPAYLLTFHST